MFFEFRFELVAIPLDRVDMREFALVGNGPDHGEALSLLESASDGIPYSVLLDHVRRVSRRLLQTLLQVLLRCLALEVVKEITHHPVERREVLLVVSGVI